MRVDSQSHVFLDHLPQAEAGDTQTQFFWQKSMKLVMVYGVTLSSDMALRWLRQAASSKAQQGYSKAYYELEQRMIEP